MLAPLTGGVGAADSGPTSNTQSYEDRRIEGWSVLVNKDLVRTQPELADCALALLRVQLYKIGRAVPPPALKRLRMVRIWVEENERHHPCMTYHPNAQWLLEHGMNAEKAKCVELANVRSFLAWTADQPWMVLHELAHAFHDQFVERGFENAEIKAAYESAIRRKQYDSVLRIDGRHDRAYAATNPMEYFAEATEAFFGTNDFYPFVRAELRAAGPGMFEILQKIWGPPLRGGAGEPERPTGNAHG
jgi:hypothetical protein